MALIGTLGSGVSALRSFVKGLEVIGNNITNVNTTGFKSSQAKYSDSFSNVLQRSAPSSANDSNTSSIAIGTGVRLASITSRFSQGELSSTGQTTDLGVSGSGFFLVRDSQTDAQFATRAGDFRVDDRGFLVTQQGMRVQGLNDGTTAYNATVSGGSLVFTATNTAPSTIGDVQMNVDLAIGAGITNATAGAFTDAQVSAAAPRLQSFTVDKNGKAVAFMSNGDTFTRGQILLQGYSDPSALVKEGNNLFSGMSSAGALGGLNLSATNNSAGTNGLGHIQSGTLELSNVDLTEEFANMITTQRSFQAGSRLVTVSDSVLQDIVDLKR